MEIEQIDKVRIVGTDEQWRDALDYCVRNGYRVVRVGPLRLGAGLIDPLRFCMEAERAAQGQRQEVTG